MWVGRVYLIRLELLFREIDPPLAPAVTEAERFPRLPIVCHGPG
jgi:hypothetical protein